MKKISIYSQAMLCAMITTAAQAEMPIKQQSQTMTKANATMPSAQKSMPSKPHLRAFELAKQEALISPNSKTETAESEWDKLLDTLDNVKEQIKTLKKAGKVSLQHEAVARHIEESIAKDLDGKTKNSVAAYRIATTASNNKIGSARHGMNEIAQNLQKRTETTMSTIKSVNAENVKAHNKAQGAVADFDAQEVVKEPAKHSKEKVMKKTEKEAKPVETTEEKQAKKESKDLKRESRTEKRRNKAHRAQ